MGILDKLFQRSKSSRKPSATVAMQAAPGGAGGTNPCSRFNGKRDTLTEHTGPVVGLAFAPCSGTLASASHDKSVVLWDTAAGALRRRLTGHTEIVCDVSFSPDGRMIASGSADKSVRTWDAESGARLQTLQGHESGVRAVAFSPTDALLASGSPDQTIRIWDPEAGRLVRTLRGREDHMIQCLAFSPKGDTLASGGTDCAVLLWDPHTGDIVTALPALSAWIEDISFSADGNTLLIVRGDTFRTGVGEVVFWDLKAGKTARVLRDDAPIDSAALTPNGELLATGSGIPEKTVKLWDANTLRLVRTLTGHSGWVYSCRFSPDGKRLATGDSEGGVLLWEA